MGSAPGPPRSLGGCSSAGSSSSSMPSNAVVEIHGVQAQVDALGQEAVDLLDLEQQVGAVAELAELALLDQLLDLVFGCAELVEPFL